MIRKVGKYQILERIGRGGMGMVFKARDPMLDRLVAVKLIASDLEVSDEIRARFFREAQACARLSHPNIVTIYDMGEEEGRLYIVMELLEGEELRQIIAQRRSMSVEEKIGVMAQVCEGLRYAHERGIVHRDIKPGNIFLLRNGVAKILDFGLAQVATADSGLTRTGLVVGTLRYISPEQVRGVADQRSDVFSVGAVFYEFLTSRPLFGGSDPMQILEQLRSEEPPVPSEVDPTIPADLSAVIERAIRKAPEARFGDLGEMGVRLNAVHRRLSEEGVRCRARLERTLGQLQELETMLSASIGWPAEASGGTIDARAGLAMLEALERSATSKLEEVQAVDAKARAVASEFERGVALERSGRVIEAVAAFEAVVGELPQHARAAGRLAELRGQIEEAQRRELAQTRLREARAAFERGSYAECLATVREIAGVAVAAGLGADVLELRRIAEAALAAQEEARREELRREQARAEEARRTAAAGRLGAAAADAATRAEPLWLAAEAKTAEAAMAFADGAYGRAAAEFEEAIALYRRGEELALEAARQEEIERQRRVAEDFRQQMSRACEAAESADAAARAPELWRDAQRKSAEGQVAVDETAFGRAGEAFQEAATLYSQAAHAAREHAHREEIQRRRLEASQAREAALQIRSAARGLHAAQRAPGQWDAAEAKFSEGDSVRARDDVEAKRLFDEAGGFYATAERAAQEVVQQERERAEGSRARAAEERQTAEAAVAARRARPLWSAAEAAAASAEGALGGGQYGAATEGFEEAAGLFKRARQAALDQVRVERERAAGAREAMRRRRESAQATAPHYAATTWTGAEETAAAGEEAFARDDYTAAEEAFERAFDLFRQADAEAREAFRQEEQRRLRGEAQTAAGLLRQARAEAVAVDAPTRAMEPWGHAEGRTQEGEAALVREQYAEAIRGFADASALYRQAAVQARDATLAEELGRQREAAERVRERLSRDRAGAAELGASARAPEVWRAAESRSAEGSEAFRRAQYVDAERAFGDASALYARALDAAREAFALEEVQRQRDEVERAGRLMARSRAAALRLDPAQHATAPWSAAEAQAAAGQALLAQERYADAAETFAHATALYEEATESALRAREALAQAVADASASRSESGVTSIVTEGDESGRGAAPSSPAVLVEGRSPRQAWALRGWRLGAGLGGLAVAVGALIFWSRGVPPAPSDVAPPPGVSSPQPSDRPAPLAPAGLTDQDRAAIDELKGRVTSARDDAAKAGADRFAGTLLSTAREHERAAEAAVARGLASEAQGAYRHALDAYAEAAKQALLQEENWKLWEQVGVARRVATLVEADKLAPDQWARATRSEQSARAALERGDHGQAGNLLKDAAAAFRSAETQALRRQQGDVKDRLAKMKQELETAEQARKSAVTARLAAQSLGVSAAASKVMAQAEQKEKEGEDALLRQDYGGAQRAFAAARSDYQAATAEGQRSRDQIAALKAETDQARNRAEARRQQAIAAEAPKLARELFDAGQEREGEGTRLASQGNLGGARQAYAEADQRYVDATRRAQGLREARSQADQARAEMAAAKQRSSQDASDHPAAVAQEQRANQLYDRLAFKEATDAYRTAGALYVKATPAPPSEPAPPQTRPSPARTGSVLVSTNIPGVEVWIGDVRLPSRAAGTTEVGPLVAGLYSVRASREGYKDWTGKVEIAAGKSTEVVIILEPAPATSTPPPRPKVRPFPPPP